MAFALLVPLSGCSDEETCKSSAECAASQICGTAGRGPYHCLESCAQDGTCQAGFTCGYVTSVDCEACTVVIRACVVAPPAPPSL